MEERFQLRHIAPQEAAILTDAVATHGRSALLTVQAQKCQHLLLCFGFTDLAAAHAVGQTRLTMCAGAPLIHARQHRIRLMHGDHGPLGDEIQIRIGDDCGHLNDAVSVRIQSGHLQIDPDQVILERHASFLPWQNCQFNSDWNTLARPTQQQ